MANQFPPPIATGKGSRSAAVDEELLSVYLENSLHVPYLQSPPETLSHSFPAKIDYETLVSSSSSSRKRDLTNQILKSVSEYGVFRISDHKIPIDEIRSLAASIFQSWQTREGFFSLKESNHDWAFRGEMNSSVASKLEEIAKEVGRILSEKMRKGIDDEIRDRPSILRANRYSYISLIDQERRLSNNQDFKVNDHALSLHVPLRHCQYHVKSRRGRHSIFDVGPNTIVVVVRKQLEELSEGEIKCGVGEFIFESNQLHGSLQSFTLEFKCSPSSLKNQSSFNNIHKKTISIHTQIIIAIILYFFYQFYLLYLLYG